jgi:hypothetical protein
MVAINPAKLRSREDWIAELTQVAYHSILDQGFRGSFLDLELSLWRAVRQSVDSITVETRAVRPIEFADAASP